jgi:GT2 family glycosyltransferase/glycosyltransferase involved in cell wall biosynthesis
VGRPIKVAFASCKPGLIAGFVEKFAGIAPDIDLFVVSEFPPPTGRWIPYRVDRSLRENYQRVRAALAGTDVRFAAVILEPNAPYRRLRWMCALFAPLRTLYYNTNLDHFMLRPRGLPVMARHFLWRARERVVFQTHPGGTLYTWVWRLRHPSQLRRPVAYAAALGGGIVASRITKTRAPDPVPARSLPRGVSVVVPSRNGRDLLARLMPRIAGEASEIIVVDNGSDDGTAEWLARCYPQVRVEVSESPLSFARAVNRGISAARFSHVCLLNNDMLPERQFFDALARAFNAVPDLFCATAQIFFPEGKRREETGKAVMRAPAAHRSTTEFPVHCIEPIAGENFTYVLYGSGGCSLYDTAKLRALGGIDEVYEPAYVEDLDIGVRAWQRGWPTVFVADAQTTHEHRATTSRYYTEEQLSRTLERNYLLFLARTVASPDLFRRMWRDAIVRLNLKAALEHDAAAAQVLATAWRFPAQLRPVRDNAEQERLLFGVGSGDVAVFPGRAQRREQTVVVASCYTPFPLSHGGAVRMYNLMKRAAADCAQVLVTFVDELHTPPPELLDICVEVVQVRRVGSHVRGNSGYPDVVEEFDSPAFRGALRLTIRKWAPSIVQLEFTQMAQYAGDCSPAKTVLVEHDVTIDLYCQLLDNGEHWEIRNQLARWERFERAAWREVDCVVTMSDRDRQSIEGARSVVTLPNGVDLVRFQPSTEEPEPRRLLFIGSFAHLPNLLALDFFLGEVWSLLSGHAPVLHVIAGANHRYHYDRARDRLRFPLEMPGLEVEGFVADVRPAYRRAAIVIAPLLASAGTNIKIMEAMAMGKAIVSTAGGVNGLDELTPGCDVIVENDAARMADAIKSLFDGAAQRRAIERSARATAERVYDWDGIAARQKQLYDSLVRS